MSMALQDVVKAPSSDCRCTASQRPSHNQDMFARAGIENPTDWTYEEYADIARRLTQDTDGDGVPNIWGAQWHIQSNTGIGPIIAAHSDWPVYLTDPFDTIVNTIEVQNAIDVLRRWIQEMHIHRHRLLVERVSQVERLRRTRGITSRS